MKGLTCLILVFFLSTGHHLHAQFQDTPPSEFPDRIMLTISGNPATSRAVTWRTSTDVKTSQAEITENNPSPQLEKKAFTIAGTYSVWETGNGQSVRHKIFFENLKPATQYAYRVGDGKIWSEWFQFTTALDSEEPFSFIYLGDVQNDIKSLGSRVIRQAMMNFPESDFMLLAGDLVNRSTDEYWNEFFYAGSWLFGMIPCMATPGNHEYDRVNENGRRALSGLWDQIFINPANGPENLRNHTFYIDYQGVRFISIDSPAMGNNKEDAEITILWLSEILENNPNNWSVVFTHYPVFSCSQGRNNEEYRDALKPVLEKYGVDLVLQGHDHTYCRGQNLDEVSVDCKNPPVYMVSVAGSKMYSLNVDKWSDRVASLTQLYQHIAINGNILEVDVYIATGQLYDSFRLVKNKEGRNKFIESKEVKNIRQRTEIPEERVKSYSEKDLRLYKERIGEFSGSDEN